MKSAVEEYLVVREKEERARKGGAGLKRDAWSRLRHVLSEPLAAKTLNELSEDDLKSWRSALASKAAKGWNGDTLSETSIRRTVNDLKAALNAAAERYRAKLPATLPIVIRIGLKVPKAKATVARPKQVLPDADVRAIVDAAAKIDAKGDWGGDLSRMVLVLAATGARFSQVIRLTVAHVQAKQSRIMMPVSHKGRGEKAATHIAVRVGEDVIKALQPIQSGRKGNEVLLLRPHWRQLGPVKRELVGRAPWLSASRLLDPWAAILAKAELASDLVPYALRHSSIVRGLRAGLPIRLVAALHDASSAMIERHYAAYIVDAMDELAARAVVSLVTPAPSPIKAVS